MAHSGDLGSLNRRTIGRNVYRSFFIKMPYTVDNPPSAVKGLPSHAIEIYVAAFNSALDQYKDEGKSAATAWAAVKTKYKKNEQGDWIAKEAVHPHGEHICVCSKCNKEITVEANVKCNTQTCPECGEPMVAKEPGEGRVDKEANVIETLREKHSEIIQELGRRNASADATRIKKIVELCQELLSSEETDEAKTKEALKEAEATLVWLKEQAVVKTEDGVEFPAAAFAYVPDSEKPSTWKLRIWEDTTQKVTRRQLGAAAAALSPGGFRGQKVQIPSEDLPAVKRKIRAAYRSLDVSEEDMPRWVKEAEIRRRILESVEIPLEEVNRESLSKGILPVRFLRPGFNEGKTRFYTKESLVDATRILDGMQMFANHQTETEARERPEGDIRDWVAVLETEGISEKGNAVGKAKIHSPWFKEMVCGLFDQGTLNKLGVSINAAGKGVKATIEGVETMVVENITGGRSVDFVTLPGAGGIAGLREAVQLVESDIPETDIDLIDLPILKEHRPDLVKEIETSTKNTLMKEVRKTMELEEEIKTLKETNETLTKENTDLKSEKETAEKASRIAETKAIIEKAVGEADLPEPAKARILERFKDAEKADGLVEAIEAEKTYIASITEAGKVKGLGGSEQKVDGKELVESFKKLGMSDKEAEIAARGR